MNLERIVQAYCHDKGVNSYRWRMKYVRDFYEHMSLDEALGYCLNTWRHPDSGNVGCHPHQTRLNKKAVGEAKVLLHEHIHEFETLQHFDEVFARIKQILGPLDGIEECTYYDASLRLGFNRGLYPTKVYLHRGSREGARALGFTGDWIEMDELPEPLRKLEAYEVEDLLCDYKEKLK